MLIDVSHISDEGFWDIMDITRAPIVATHSNSRAVWNNSRNLTDDMFRAIAQTGGVAGYNVCAEFTGEKPTLDTMCDHILHFMELDPSGKHIALGGDLDGITEMPPDLRAFRAGLLWRSGCWNAAGGRNGGQHFLEQCHWSDGMCCM